MIIQRIQDILYKFPFQEVYRFFQETVLYKTLKERNNKWECQLWGDSDSTGVVTGNIVGACVGYENIDKRWKNNLELSDIILELATDLCHGCQMSEYGSYTEKDWLKKYVR